MKTLVIQAVCHASRIISEFFALIEIKFRNTIYVAKDIGQSYTRKIRNNCSNLNNLYDNHLSLDPYCNCGNEIEDAEHFFFNCPKFTDKHILLFNAIRNLHPFNTDKLLKGDINLTSQENTTIFIAVQNNIKITGRFTEA